jgi:hypothetical protein
MFIAIRLGQYYYSYDGTNWTQSSFLSNSDATSFAWSREKGIIAAGRNYSRDGITWVKSINGEGIVSVGWGKELGIFTGISQADVDNNNYSYYSYDGITWIKVDVPFGFLPNRITWSPLLSMFICNGYTPDYYATSMYSRNGRDWIFLNFVFDHLIWINELSLFVAGRQLAQTYTSIDGINWVQIKTRLVCSDMWSPELGRIVAAGGYSDVTKTF